MVRILGVACLIKGYGLRKDTQPSGGLYAPDVMFLEVDPLFVDNDAFVLDRFFHKPQPPH